ncbi:Gamma-glutamylputrescine oxidoreductase [bacterium HR12]|nr:Gamma-glutamylputrescine oxidoreductase [bacterium HR12]
MRSPADARLRRTLVDARPISSWLDDPGRPEPLEPLRGKVRADLAIVGAGFTGLWAALEARERDPGRAVVVVEGGRVGWGASGRNGGFVASSLTHGLDNGLRRFPDEIEELERQGLENFAGLVEAIGRYGIRADLELGPVVLLARRPHEVGWFEDAAAAHRRFGYEAEVLDAEGARRIVRSPVFVGGLRIGGQGHALVNPARLAWGLRDAALALGVRIFERSPAVAIERDGGGVVVRTADGAVRAERAILATNGFPPLLRRIRAYVVPVYDHVLMTEPLSAEQRRSIGWEGREGLADAANRFHYFRLSTDDRILWGGYDATYHFGGRTGRRLELDDAVHLRLARHFFATFPQLEGLRFTHRWGGIIDTCSRYAVFFGTALGGRVAYAVGYTGLGVAATRFGARTALDLVDGLGTERTALRFVRTKPVPFPPEPLRFLAIRQTVRAYDRLDRTGRRGPWLALLDRLGLGFQS